LKRITAPESPPPAIESAFIGEIRTVNEYPTAETLDRLYEELDFQRACQVFLRHITASSMYSFREGLRRDLGATTPHHYVTWRGPFDANSLLLTPNSETVYGVGYLALEADGPTVVEAPAGVLGVFNDMCMRGREHRPGRAGSGRRRLVSRPPAGLSRRGARRILRSACEDVRRLARLARLPGARRRRRSRRGYAQAGPRVPAGAQGRPPEMTFVNASGRVLDTIHPVDGRYFEDLAQLVGEEHEDAIDPETAGMLAAIGIAKGEPFEPDERMRRILGEAATVGSFMALATSYKPRLPLSRYDDRQWLEIANTGYPDYRVGNHTMLDGVSLMGWFATVSSKAMVRPMLGKGSVYMWTYTSGDAKWLDGAKNYRLHLPSGIPAASFWSIVVYDVWTRSMLANGQPEASARSRARTALRRRERASPSRGIGRPVRTNGSSPGARARSRNALASVRTSHCQAALLLFVEAVAQTPGEPAGSFLRAGSENGHLVHRAQFVHRAVVAHDGLACLSACALRLFRSGFMRQPPSNAGVSRSRTRHPLPRERGSAANVGRYGRVDFAAAQSTRN
jgi:hypothetical protein